VAFLIGYAIRGTNLAWMMPYVDPMALLIISLALIPMPLKTVRDALADILLMTPQDLRQSVDRTAANVVERYGFVSYRAYVARVGRGTQIELHFIAPLAWPARTLEEWDNLREKIGAELGEPSPDRWLTIAFTTRLDWAA
jgi:predicted Co/Zn/Cd cation transporter (cation efflux family)